jgi:hypothetical protein
MITRSATAGFVLALLLAACAGGSTPAPVPVASNGSGGGGGSAGPTGGSVSAGGDLCGLLGPGDFAAVGVGGTGKPTENNQDANDVYCVFAGKSGATGGVEFDAFLGASSADSPGTFIAATEGIADSAGAGKAALPEVDDARLQTDIAGGYAALVVSKGKVVFSLAIPTTSSAKDQLVALAKLVLARVASLT